LIGGRRIADLVRDRPSIHPALAYAQRLHAGQRRKTDDTPFILHPFEVASLLHHAGVSDRVVVAGALHDVIEKTEAGPAELTERFGPEVTALVLAVSEDERIGTYEARKAALRSQVAGAGHDALMVFAADKISKVRELRRETDRKRRSGRRPAASTTYRRRLAHYAECLQLLEAGLGNVPLVGQLRTELEELHAPTKVRPALASAV
jgi:(p)ppGpp synthase/HD superfamily hydrolase